MLNEKQLATILVKIKVNGVLKKLVRGVRSRAACEGVILDYLRRNLKFARALNKAGMSVEKLVNMLYNAR